MVAVAVVDCGRSGTLTFYLVVPLVAERRPSQNARRPVPTKTGRAPRTATSVAQLRLADHQTSG